MHTLPAAAAHCDIMPPMSSALDGQAELSALPIRLGDDVTSAPAAPEQPTTGLQILSANPEEGGQLDLSTFTDYLNDKIAALLPDGVDLHGVDPTVLLSVLLLCVFIVLGACVNRCSCVNLALRWCRLLPRITPQYLSRPFVPKRHKCTHHVA